MPSWLLNDPSMKVRSTYPPFLKAVDNYFSELIPLVAGLQYSRGGPIIAFQIENEYGAYEQDKKYLEALKDSLLKYGVEELMLTADPAEHLEKGSLPGVLPTATFNTISRGDLAFKNIAALSPEWPLVTMEFWPGWYDVWGSKHNTMKDEEMEAVLSFILKSGSSVNFYMFHGGTNFGFMNGAYYPSYVATVTSYDYDAPVNEQGEANTKFTKIIETLFKNVPESVSSTLPPIPPARPVEKYGTLEIEKYLLLDDMVKRMKAIYGIEAVPMEFLGQVNNGGGQGYGFILYRTEITKGGKLKFSDTVRDRAVVLLNGTEIATFNLNKKDMVVAIKGPNKPQNKTTYVLDVLVENMGRLNSMGYYNGTKVPFESQRKGITSTVYLDKAVLIDWDHYPLEFRKPFLTSMLSSGDWSPYKDVVGTPGMFYTRLTVTKHPPCDTFIDMKGWKKGVVFVNGFNLGRYWEIGPQRTLYLPGPLLRTGNNEILIFELHGSKPTITFKDKPQLDL
ncbi:beta-galactosidase-1-like protein 2 isoform X2 [Lingula anatina]|nr:beta-galactosidase-1-like protein 2 isoform X2 [Lingula anatina]|eukprot:XP_013392796.1 beta-galactosidase-1-like protein 2 isoform X2 [Lingula anatina]